MIVSLSLAVAFVAALIGTGLMRQYAVARGILDLPNHRSSHALPMPRGGGVAIVAAFFGAVVWYALSGLVTAATSLAIIGGGAVVAVVGFLDDRRTISVRWRLLAHFAAVTWALVVLGGMPAVALGATLVPAWLTNVATSFAMVWLLNLYNFMDGIDGIAGVEALTVTAAAAVIHLAGSTATPSAVLLPAALACSVLGFLVWNFPPARIFMGDAGSGFLGLVLGILAARDTLASTRWLWIWTILLGVFVVDATTTLLGRILRAERLYEPHRNHAYQRATVRLGSHRTVTLGVGMINIFWLFPLALLVDAEWIDPHLATALAYLPLLGVAWRISATGKHKAKTA